MIDTKALRNKILDAAIRGKLTEQLPEDGYAEELYNQIQEEKQKLIKEGKIKKEKTLLPITNDELPFKIPSNWKWVHVGDICINISYGTSSKSSPNGKIPVLRMGNIKNGKIDYSDLVYTSNDDEIKSYPLNFNDLLFNRTNSKEQVGKVAIYKGERPAIYAGYLVRVTPLCDSDYANYIFQSRYYYQYCQNVKNDGVHQSNINAEKFKAFIFPLSPLNEQKRIVEKIMKVFSLLDIIDELQSKLADNSVALKSKLIELGIQGKLTEQLPEDGDAEDLYKQIQEEKQRLIKEGKIKKGKNESYIFRRDNSHYEKQGNIKRCIDDEIPFDIPENWKWVQFGTVM